jgi:hypothetical protein
MQQVSRIKNSMQELPRTKKTISTQQIPLKNYFHEVKNQFTSFAKRQINQTATSFKNKKSSLNKFHEHKSAFNKFHEQNQFSQ